MLEGITGFGGRIHFFTLPKQSFGGELCVSMETCGGHFIYAAQLGYKKVSVYIHVLR